MAAPALVRTSASACLSGKGATAPSVSFSSITECFTVFTLNNKLILPSSMSRRLQEWRSLCRSRQMPVCQRILGTKLQKIDQQVKSEVWEGVYSPVHQRGDVQEVRNVQVSSRLFWALL